MPWLICIPLRLMERICPFGRITAEPPPRRFTCRPGRGRFTRLARVSVLPLGPPFVIGPRVLLIGFRELFMLPGPFVRFMELGEWFMFSGAPVLPVVVPGLPMVPG